MENRKKGEEGSRFVNLCNENSTTPSLILISISICSMLFIENGRKKKRRKKKEEKEKEIISSSMNIYVKCQIKLTNYRAECANIMCNILRKYFLYKVFVFIWDKIPISGFRNNACIIGCQYCLCCRNICITGVPWGEIRINQPVFVFTLSIIEKLCVYIYIIIIVITRNRNT